MRYSALSEGGGNGILSLACFFVWRLQSVDDAMRLISRHDWAREQPGRRPRLNDLDPWRPQEGQNSILSWRQSHLAEQVYPRLLSEDIW